jgi:hypothetical protein
MVKNPNDPNVSIHNFVKRNVLPNREPEDFIRSGMINRPYLRIVGDRLKSFVDLIPVSNTLFNPPVFHRLAEDLHQVRDGVRTEVVFIVGE